MIRSILTAFVILLASATAAHADPISSAIAAITAFAKSSAIAAFIVQTGFSLALSALARVMRGPMDMQEPDPAGIRTDVTTNGGDNPQSFILGLYATGGNMVAPPYSHPNNGGVPNRMLSYVVDLSDIPVTALSRVMVSGEYIDDFVSLSDPHFDLGAKFNAKGNPQLSLKFYDGTQQAADAYMLENYGDHPERPWSADMVGSGVAYVVMQFRYNRRFYNQMPGVRFEVKGIALYDPRLDTSAGGEGAQRWDDPATWAFSENPVVMIYNILRGITLPDGRVWGGSVSAEALPFDAWAAAMNECDAPVELKDGGAEPQYRAGYEVSVDQEPARVIEELLKACSGEISEFGGIYNVRVGPPALPVFFLSDGDIVADQSESLTPYPGLEDVHNAIHATHPDPSATWEPRDAPAIYNPAWEAEDGDRQLVASVNLSAVASGTQVQRLMQAWLNDARRFRRHAMSLPPEAAVLGPLDCISWTSDREGYAGKLFEVGEVSDDLTTCIQSVNLRERDGSDFEWVPASDERPVPPASPGVVVPAPRVLVGLSASGYAVEGQAGAPRRPAILLAWTADELEDFEGLEFVVQLSTGEPVDAGLVPDAAAGQAVISSGIVPAAAYRVRARIVSDAGPGAWSDWLSVSAPDIRVSNEDLADAVAEEISQASETAAKVRADHDALVGDFTGDLPGEFLRLDNGIASAAQSATADKQAAETARDAAQAAKVAAEAARSAAETASTTSQTARTASQDARDAAQAAASAAGDDALAASNSAGAAAGHASTATTKADEAAGAATAAAADASAAQTARGQAQSARDQAATSETNAAGSASAASTSEGNAAQSATDAGQSATAASGSASSAASDATAASQSASAAQSAKAAAETARGQAQSARDQAATSETNAAGSASAASTSEGNAAQSATDAGQSATAASGSASSAASDATAASQSASAAQSAKTAAETARGQAQSARDQAATSETNAAGSASAASTSEGNAAQSATDAGQSATAASASASSAASDATAASQSASAAQSARTAAETARSQAQTAQTGAVSAKNTAESASAQAVSARDTAVTVRDQAVGLTGDPYFNLPESAVAWAGSQTWRADRFLEPGTDAQVGGQDLVCRGYEALYFADYQPIDRSRVYRVTVRIRQVSVVSGTNPRTYVGLRTYSGSYGYTGNHYFVLSAANIPADGEFHEYTATYAGSSFPAAARFFTRMALINYSNGNSGNVARLSMLKVEDVTDVQDLSASVSQQSSAIASLEGYASANFALSVRAGDASGRVYLTAFDNPGGSGSNLKIDVDNVDLEGNLSADWIDAGKMNARHLAVTETLSLKTAAAAFSMGKGSASDFSNPGIFIGRRNSDGSPGFGFLAGRVNENGFDEYIQATDEAGLRIVNGRFFQNRALAPDPVTLQSSQSFALPAGARTLSFEIIGGGGGGAGGGNTETSALPGYDGGNTVLELRDGSTTVKVWTSAGGAGGAGLKISNNANRGDVGGDSPYGEGGRGGKAELSSGLGQDGFDATGFGAGGGGAGGGGNNSDRCGLGGESSVQVEVSEYDISGLSSPNIVLTCGPGGGGGLGNNRGGNGGDGTPGFMTYRVETSSPIRSDVIPLRPTATGTMNSRGPYPDLGSGLWVINRDNGTNVTMGTIEIDDEGTRLDANYGNPWVFVSEKTPVHISGGNSRTVHYTFYKMGA